MMDTLTEVTDLRPIAALGSVPLPVIDALIKEEESGSAGGLFRDAIDLNDIIIKNQGHTYFGIAWSDSMEPRIPEGSFLIVDRKEQVFDGKYVIVELDGHLCMKRFVREYGKIKLLSENPDYPPIVVNAGANLRIFGRITHVIGLL